MPLPAKISRQPKVIFSMDHVIEIHWDLDSGTILGVFYSSSGTKGGYSPFFASKSGKAPTDLTGGQRLL